MPKPIDVICTNCPMGCKITLNIDDRSEEVLAIEGNKCKQGKQYALAEYKNPVRVLTATVRTDSKIRRLLPVRTDKPIPKDMMKDMMYIICKIVAKNPVKIGQIIEPNIMDSNADLIAAADLIDK